MTNTNCRLRRSAQVALIALPLFCVFGLAQAGDLYKWTDYAGKVHYSDTLPEGVKAQRIPEGNLSIIPGPALPESIPDAAPATGENPREGTAAHAFAERRQEMIEDCETNNGTECGREVDTELRAEAIEFGGRIIHQARPAGGGMR
jgi:hypothetical protein